MKCPQCGNEAPDNAAICDHCDHILDPSFFDQEDTDPEAEALSENPGEDSSDATAEFTGESTSETQALPPRSAEDTPVENDIPAQPVDEPVDTSAMGDFEALWFKARVFFKGLSFYDKGCAAGAAALCLLTFFPWISGPAHESLIGLDVGGFWVLLMSIGTIGLIFCRKQGLWAQYRTVQIYAQTALSLFALLMVVWVLLDVGTPITQAPVSPSVDPDLRNAANMQVAQTLSSVQMGIALIPALLASLAATAGSGMTLMEQFDSQ